jgi:O-antigen/teichoic acid export membrane protein
MVIISPVDALLISYPGYARQSLRSLNPNRMALSFRPMPLQRKTILDYLTITSGVFGRLVISVVYFLIVANVLTLGEFGVFASASAVGLVLSRLMAFGFISPVYRVATVKPRLLGVYIAGLLAFAVASLPLILLAAIAVHALVFSGRIDIGWFLAIIACEVLGWRLVEYVVIQLNGLSRFGRAAALVILGSGIRTLAAIAFFLLPWRGLEIWIVFYALANAVTLALAFVMFAPKLRLRFAWRVYPRRMRDAVTAALSELTFYVQSELDKLLVLTMAGDRTAGLYAIAMRLIDLTAVPIRSFNQMLVQRMMSDVAVIGGWSRRAIIEGLIAIVSTLGMLCFIIVLWMHPGLLGRNIEQVAPYLLLMMAIPALRNLVEYQGELLYAREKVVTRATLLAALAALKLSMMAALLTQIHDFQTWALPLTGIFLLVYLLSTAVTYRSLASAAR